MFQILKRNPRAAITAAVMHLAIIILLVVGVDWLKDPEQAKIKVDVVKARVVDEARVAAEVEKLKQAEQAKKTKQQKEQQRLADLKKKAEAEKKRLADLEKKRKAEQQKLAREKKQREQEEAKLKETEAKRKAAEEAERKRKAAEEAERKKKAEEAKQKAADEAERKRKAEEAAQKAREDELREAMEAEQQAGEINRYTGQIQQKLMRNWVRPAGIGEGLKCTLQIRLAGGGNVINAVVIKSSGNEVFDRSAEAAVLKADPLPVPTGNLFEQFREIDLVFDPEATE